MSADLDAERRAVAVVERVRRDADGQLNPAPRAASEESPTATRPAALGVRQLVGRSLTVFGGVVVAFLVFVFALSGLQQARDQDGLESQFRARLAAGRAPIGGVIEPGTPVATLHIPVLRSTQTVIEGSDGTQLKQAPGHVRSSALPGQAGNAVIIGHRLAYGGPFRNLDQLHNGDRITFTTGQGDSSYVVDSVEHLSGSDVSTFNGTENRLALATASSLLHSSDRLVVYAHLDGDPKDTPPIARLTTVPGDELGLSATTTELFPLLFWVQVLVLASVVAVLLYRRWNRWPSYLITTPILAAALWLVFENVSLLLPGTI